MEEDLLAAVMAEEDDNAIEHIIIDNLLINRDRELGLVNPFNLDEIPDEEIRENFRFDRDDIQRLAEVLGLPERIITDTQNNVNRVTALCILLRRLVCPNRLGDISKMFRFSPQSISQIIRKTTEVILHFRGNVLDNLNNLQWLNRDKMSYYAQAVLNKGGALDSCWAFLDGTKRSICRPSVAQQEYYSGHNRQHCLKYQSILSPDGIIVSLKGAWPGRRHDAGMFRESMLYELEQKAVYGEEKFVLYADQGYGIMELLITPFPGRREDLQPQQLAFNNSMKILRVSVEWGFQKVVALFAFVDFKKNQKLLLQDLESLYKVAVILTNCHTCLYGSQVSTYFNTVPPTLNEYFGV